MKKSEAKEKEGKNEGRRVENEVDEGGIVKTSAKEVEKRSRKVEWTRAVVYGREGEYEEEEEEEQEGNKRGEEKKGKRRRTSVIWGRG